MSLFGPPNIDKMLKNKNVAGLIKALQYKHDGPGAFVYDLMVGASETDLFHAIRYIEVIRDRHKREKVNQVRTSAARALGQLGDPQAVDPLLSRLEDEYGALRNVLISTLASFDDPRVVDPLHEKLYLIEDAETKFKVIHTLRKFNDPRAIEELISMLGERDDKLRNAAVKSLIEIGDTEIAEQLAGQLVDDSNWEKPRKAAAQVLVSLGAHAVEPLVDAIGDNRYSRDKITLNTFVGIGTPAVEPLIGRLNDDEEERIRMFACRALGEIGDPKAIQPLAEIVKDEKISGALRETAAKALVQLDWKPDDDESKVWYSLAKRDWDELVTYGSAAVAPLLVLNDGYTFQGDESKIATETLKRIGTPAVDPLIAALNHDDWQVQKMAAVALALIGDPKSVGPLKEAFKNDGWDDLGPFALALKQMKKSLPQPKRISAEERKQALDVLNKLCAAYAGSKKTVIRKLEPQARRIGEDAHQRGGLLEMRRLFKRLKKSPGKRNLEFFWGGIGEWRG
jgi:HEAT repeat protein